MKLTSTLVALSSLVLVASCAQDNVPNSTTPGTESATTHEIDAKNVPKNNDPQSSATNDDSAHKSSKNKSVKQNSSTATQKKLDATRPGTESDLGGGNSSSNGSAGK